MIKVTLKDGSIIECESGISVIDAAKQISMGLARVACAARINGENADLRTKLNEDCALEILTFDDEYGKWTFRHTASHILAQAVKRLYPDVKLAIGPAVDDGFYYDIDLGNDVIREEDLEKIEKEMKKISKSNKLIKSIPHSLNDSIFFINSSISAELVILHLPLPVISIFFPSFSFCSYNVTLFPAFAAVTAAIIPAGPPPIMTIFFIYLFLCQGIIQHRFIINKIDFIIQIHLIIIPSAFQHFQIILDLLRTSHAKPHY